VERYERIPGQDIQELIQLPPPDDSVSVYGG